MQGIEESERKNYSEDNLIRMCSFWTPEGRAAVRKLKELHSKGIYGTGVRVELSESSLLEMTKALAGAEKEHEERLRIARMFGRAAARSLWKK